MDIINVWVLMNMVEIIQSMPHLLLQVLAKHVTYNLTGAVLGGFTGFQKPVRFTELE